VIPDADHLAAADTLHAVQGLLNELTVRGLRACGPRETQALGHHADALRRMGVEHLARELDALAVAIREAERSAAATLLRARTRLRVFERLLTKRAAIAQLGPR